MIRVLPVAVTKNVNRRFSLIFKFKHFEMYIVYSFLLHKQYNISYKYYVYKLKLKKTCIASALLYNSNTWVLKPCLTHILNILSF
jgi:hypothetical protein